MLATPPLYLLQEMKKWVEDFLKQNVKVAPLLEIRDPSRWVEKATVERKLLSSVLYELAKMFAASSANASVNVSRKLVFDAFWSYFPNFPLFEQQVCAFKGNRLSFKLMCNSIFSSAVSSSTHRLKATSK